MIQNKGELNKVIQAERSGKWACRRSLAEELGHPCSPLVSEGKPTFPTLRLPELSGLLCSLVVFNETVR